MATKDEIVTGIELLIQEARRVSTALTDDQWQHVVDLDGWKNREVLAHIAGVGGLVGPMVSGMAAAPAGTDSFAAINIDEINAGLVGARAGKSAVELADEAATAYTSAIAFIRGADDEMLARKVTVQGYQDVPLSEILMRMCVLHGLAHIYSVYASVFNSKA
jgi:hypothetical protein